MSIKKHNTAFKIFADRNISKTMPSASRHNVWISCTVPVEISLWVLHVAIVLDMLSPMPSYYRRGNKTAIRI